MGRNQNSHPWSTEEIVILKQYYPDGGTEEVLKHLKNRTKTSIQVKCSKLKIKTNKQGFYNRSQIWTNNEKNILKEWFPKIGYRKSERRKVIGTPFILDFLPNRSISSIINQSRKLKLTYNPQKNVKSGYHRCFLCLEIKIKTSFTKWSLSRSLFNCRDCEKKIHDNRYNNLEYRLIKSLNGFFIQNKIKSPSTEKLRLVVNTLLEKYDYECFFKDEYCDLMERIGVTIGHKNPISLGGDIMNVENLFFICMGHNSLMSNLTFDQFLPSLKSMNKILDEYSTKTLDK